MTPQDTAQLIPDLAGLLKSGRTESVPMRPVLDHLGRLVPFAQALIVSTMPRGSLQIIQPGEVSEAIVRGYGRGLHAEDRLTWSAILRGRAVTGAEAHGSAEAFESSRYAQELLRQPDLRHAAAAPLTAPLFDGYPGALHVYRAGDAGPVTDAELDLLVGIARQVDQLFIRARDSRRRESHRAGGAMARSPAKLILLDQHLREFSPAPVLPSLDRRVREQLLHHAQRRLDHGNGAQVAPERVQFPDTHGDLWTFRAVTYREYPALGDGSYAVMCLIPDCREWSLLRPSDVQADPELSRLVPSIQFMQREFHRGPTLGEIAKTVHLSPFHFHRRFAELMGLTPKHFLLECQINAAKRELRARSKQLSQIATDCGFAHQSHFTSRFKQATGLTPTRWRRIADQAHGAGPGQS